MRTIRNNSVGIAMLGVSVSPAFAQLPAGAQPQGRGFCGTVVSQEQIDREIEWQDAGFFDGGMTRGADFKYMRVAIHIVRYTDGTGGVSTADIQTGLNEANEHFADARLVFIPIYSDYIDNSTYAEIADDTEGDALRQLNVVAGALNIYFVPDAPYCGQSTFPNGTPGGDATQGIIVANSCTASGGVLAHEIGHYFLLYHTHETALGTDCPNGGNCSGSGDLVCDTPPDPGLHNCTGGLGSCVDSCEYTGSYTCSGVAYSPDPRNTMSYTDPDCMTGFSTGQNSRIATAVTLADRSDEIALEHLCGWPTYAQPGLLPGLGLWAFPDGGLRAGINRASIRCSGAGVVIARRGNYFEGPGVFSTPMTIIASREGTGDVVIRP